MLNHRRILSVFFVYNRGVHFLLSLLLSLTLVDLDYDGIDDKLEQELLQKFVPQFMISAGECDTLPSEFAAGSAQPDAVERNGTIYGQVFNRDGFTEIHYYHLWAKDCGRAGHKLDVEHVSVLLSSAYEALYWYAAAHEDTLCNASSAARASTLRSENRGATIWISRGKHASFLTQERCSHGCGSDQCREMTPMRAGRLINIGEPGQPLNGATWMQSTAWPLASKMTSDFTDSLLRDLAEPTLDRVISATFTPPPMQALVLSSNWSFTAFLMGNQKAGIGAFKGLYYSGRSLLTTGRQLSRWLGLRKIVR